MSTSWVARHPWSSSTCVTRRRCDRVVSGGGRGARPAPRRRARGGGRGLRVVEEVPPDVIWGVVDTNVLGTIAVARSARPALRRTGGGRLVVVGSLLGEVAMPYMSSYVLSKWAVHGLVRSLQIEVRDREGACRSRSSPLAASTPPSTARRPRCWAGTAPPPPPVGTADDVAGPGVLGAFTATAAAGPRRAGEPASSSPASGCSPAVYDAIVTPALRTFGLDDWRGLPATTGNVHHPQHPAPASDGSASAPVPARTPTASQENLMSEDEALARPRASRSIAAPAEAVWAVLADGWQYATWVVGASRVRAVDAGWPQGGHPVTPQPRPVAGRDLRRHRVERGARSRTTWCYRQGLAGRGAKGEIEIVPDGPDGAPCRSPRTRASGPGRCRCRAAGPDPAPQP